MPYDVNESARRVDLASAALQREVRAGVDLDRTRRLASTIATELHRAEAAGRLQELEKQLDRRPAAT